MCCIGEEAGGQVKAASGEDHGKQCPGREKRNGGDQVAGTPHISSTWSATIAENGRQAILKRKRGQRRKREAGDERGTGNARRAGAEALPPASQLVVIVLRHMAIDVYAAQQGEDQRQRRQAEDLEVDPDILWQPECDVDIGQTAENKKQRPGKVQT